MGKKRGIDPLHYSTEGLPPAKRHDAWAERSWPSVAAVFDSTPIGAFSTSADFVLLGGVMVSFAQGSARALDRTVEKISQDGMDAFGVGVVLEGEMRGVAGALRFKAGAGEILLLDAAQPCSIALGESRSVQLAVPRALAEEAGFDVARLHGFVVNANAAVMLVSHLWRIREALPQLSEDEGPRVARTLLDMLVLAVNATARAGLSGEGANASPLSRVRHEIQTNLGSPTLSIANLCRRLDISRSTLHRLFEAEGGVQTFIRNSRLDAVRRALLDSASKERIGDLAERLGFSDAAHLSRLFRARYGETPSEFRARSGRKATAAGSTRT